MGHRLFAIAVSVSVLVGCASPYGGGRPDTSLGGAKVSAEIDKFTLDESYHWLRLEPWLAMGREENPPHYTVESLRPLISDVSPAADKILDDVKWWRRGQYLAVGLAAALVVTAFAIQDNDSERNSLFTLGTISAGTAVGFGFVVSSLLSQAATQYNQDLHHAFRASVGLNFP